MFVPFSAFVVDGYGLQQEEVAAERRAKRAEVYVAPAESAAPSVEEKRKRKRTEGDVQAAIKSKHRKT